MRPMWFSDGGIGSNFPIHMFDAALPLWPTFAINLVYPASTTRLDRTGAVFLPDATRRAGNAPTSTSATASPPGDVAGFLSGSSPRCKLARLLLARAPGHRDRIVTRVAGVEGGLNLDMPQPVSTSPPRARQAGETLRRVAFENHYWCAGTTSPSACSVRDKYARAHDPTLRISDYATAYALQNKPIQPASYPCADFYFSSATCRHSFADWWRGGRPGRHPARPDAGTPRPAADDEVAPICC